jgi:hypothetical protein
MAVSTDDRPGAISDVRAKDSDDEIEWAHAILRILGDPERARVLSRRGIERSEAFSAVRSK